MIFGARDHAPASPGSSLPILVRNVVQAEPVPAPNCAIWPEPSADSVIVAPGVVVCLEFGAVLTATCASVPRFGTWSSPTRSLPRALIYRYDATPSITVKVLVRIFSSISSCVSPQRPQEASGTSGMKAALNGVPSLSVLDGGWIESCLESVTGWAIRQDDDVPRDPSEDRKPDVGLQFDSTGRYLSKTSTSEPASLKGVPLGSAAAVPINCPIVFTAINLVRRCVFPRSFEFASWNRNGQASPFGSGLL